MNNICKLASVYPRLDLLDIKLLQIIAELPGLTVASAAEIAGISRKTAQLRIALLSGGRKTRPGSSRYGFITEDKNFADKRKRSLALTEAGETLLEQITEGTGR
ncbi:hypothetical protein [Victivallis sp. Marseille-Q1083]|uniref:hypothetical protein n=1 Tax=Victivallis sp. Marseille-Q1083 TaxID=2717288 RepID=UPI00158B89A8|nr:hypothetical protein [Victivallis sp. Marseille-Q1083]